MSKDKQDSSNQLYKIRHSLAHILAQAVLEIRPDTQLGFGPPVENGFYYDFLFKEPITNEDLPEIEKRMRKLVKSRQKFEMEELPGNKAIERLKELKQELKIEYAKDLINQGQSVLRFYKNTDFIDMCEGPHIANTSEIPAGGFILDQIAGAYWRGDESRPMLVRIYGLAFESKENLEDFLKQRKLALERDHRKLGKELEIFGIFDEVGPGLVLWYPNGTVLRDELEALAKETEFRAGYKRVFTPHLTKSSLYEISGHLTFYKDSMYPAMEMDNEQYYLKPMNCPHHHMIYKHRPRSYRELPLRLCEYGTVYRYEQSGALAGLLRVRGMTMNDAHIYCRQDQLEQEFTAVLEMHKYYYSMFRLSDFWMRLSLHDPVKDKFAQNEELWNKSEEIIRGILKNLGTRFEEKLGEAAFYGPKVDFQIKNVVGREETASTNQLDFIMSERFDLKYVKEDGTFDRPLIIHRAPLGTHERFISFLLEHLGGAFPTWLAPIQVMIIPVADQFLDYANRISAELTDNLCRVEIDESNNTLNKKIRNAVTSKIPNILIIGQREMEEDSVTWRRYAVSEQVTIKRQQFINTFLHLKKNRVMDCFPDVNVML